MSTSSTCDLCGLPVIGRPIADEHGSYCCEGCRRVDTVAREAGIDLSSAGGASVRRADAATARKVAAALAAGARRDTFRVEGMWCASCSLVLVDALMALPGVLDAEVSYAASLARVTRDPEIATEEQVRERFELLGYHARPASEAGPADADTGDLFLRLFVSVVLGMWIMWPTLLVLWPQAALTGWAAQQPIELFTGAFSLVVLLFGGWPFLRGAWHAARIGRATMDTLVVLGTWTAWLYSAYATLWGGGPTYFDSAAMITSIVLLGRWIEALGAAQSASALATAARPEIAEAWRVPSEDEIDAAERTPAGELVAGDLVVVRPGEISPVDGTIVRGRSETDRSALTGESLPVACAPGDEIWAGSLNLSDLVVVRVTRVAEETLAGRLADVVEDAAFAKSHTERVVDMVASLFVPAVIAASVLTAVTALVAGNSGAEAVSRAVAVLVVACPCALALATPLAVSSASGAAARKGAVLRGSPTFERINDIEIVAFDKTGTLTTGSPHLSGIVHTDSDDPREQGELLAIAARLEAGDPHPIAQALTAAIAAGTGGRAPLSVERVPGMGLRAAAESGAQLLLGNERLLEQHGAHIPRDAQRQAELARDRGELVVWLAEDERALAGLRFADAVRAEASEVLAALKRQGLEVAMVSGDATGTCVAVAEQLGIDEVHGEVLPHEKESVVRELQERGAVAYVGDGLNDAAALAAADLAIGVAGASDLAVLAADVVLVGADTDGSRTSPLASTVALLRIARATRRVIRQNLAWAFTYNLVAFPLAATGRLSPIWAAAAMAGSSVAVVLNSLRLGLAAGRSKPQPVVRQTNTRLEVPASVVE